MILKRKKEKTRALFMYLRLNSAGFQPFETFTTAQLFYPHIFNISKAPTFFTFST
jgi:hypothetical protein